MNSKQLVLMRLTLTVAIWSYAFDSPLERSIYGWVGWIAVVLGIIVVYAEVFARIGEAAADFSMSFYKFLLSPLMRDYNAKENNYKEIIKGLQKQLSRKE